MSTPDGLLLAQRGSQGIVTSLQTLPCLITVPSPTRHWLLPYLIPTTIRWASDKYRYSISFVALHMPDPPRLAHTPLSPISPTSSIFPRRTVPHLADEFLQGLAQVHLHGLEHHHHVLLVLEAAQQPA